MPTHLHIGFEEMSRAMKGVTRLQRLATQHGVENIFTDNGGKLVQILVATGLDYVPGRTGPDASDRSGNYYEIKSTDRKANVGFGTSHHLNMSILDRYRDHIFIFAIFDGIEMHEVYRVFPRDLEPLFVDWEMRLWDVDHLNNPKIPLRLVRKVGDIMYAKDVPAPWTPGPNRRKRPYRYEELVSLGYREA